MRPLLPFKEKALTPRDAADLLRGLAELVEVYPVESVVISLDLQAGQEKAEPKKTRTRSTKPK
jgi:hypothetical protein